MAATVVGYSVAAIQKMFRDYVGDYDGRIRHTPAANKEIGVYSEFIQGAFPKSAKLRDDLYDRMLSCAVEFEESGFIAGFQTGFQCALGLLSDTSPSVADSAPAPERASDGAAVKPAKPRSEATITSREIAKMFETPNAKVVRRIENMILPRLDDERRQCFQLDIEYTPQHRRVRVYHLDRTACELYVKEVDVHRKFIKIASGIEKMRDRMKTVFPEASAS